MSNLLLRRRMLMQAGGSPTPINIVLDYIKASGIQWIDNIPFDKTWNIDLLFAFDTNSPRQQRIINGSNSNNSVYINGNGNYAFSREGDWANSQINALGIHRFQYINRKVYCDNVEKKTYNSDGVDVTNLSIFHRQEGDNPCSGRIYYLVMTDSNSNKMVELKPVLYNNIPCLYDSVNNSYHYNDGSGDFAYNYVSNYKTILPNEYQQVEYLESSGAQYIDTLIYPHATYSVSVEFCLSQYINTWHTVVGARRSASDRFTFRYNSSGNAFGIQRSPGSGYNQESHEENFINIGNSIDIYHKIEFNPTSNIVDDYYTFGNYNTPSNDNPFSYKWFLFALNDTNTPADYLYGRIKHFSVKDTNNSYVCDMYPCYRKSDNKPGMYDTIRNVFLTNSGTDEFIVGQNI